MKHLKGDLVKLNIEISQSLCSYRNDKNKNMKLKVCGMKYNPIEVAELQPDYLGFIFYNKSARHFTGNIPELPASIKKVGVFVNVEIDKILEKIEKYELDAVQLHGNETPEYCKELKCHYEEQSDKVTSLNRLPRTARNDKLEIIKVFSIKDEFNFDVLKPYEEFCDYFLFDTKGKLPGGNGYSFDWNVLQNYPSTKPFFLSGGIGFEELEKLQEFLSSKAAKYCYAIDVNSRFEIEPGLKELEKLKEFKNNLSF